MNKYIFIIALLCAAVILLSGCSPKLGGDVFALPNLPKEYVSLQNELNVIISNGAEYAAAENGVNRQAVQLVDLNADGTPEAIAVFTSGDGAIKAYVFGYGEDRYAQIGVLESYGRRIWSVDYPVCSEKGDRAIALSVTFDDEVTYGMTVASVRDGELRQMLDLQYSEVLFEDTDSDGCDELFFAVRNGASGAYLAQMYKLSGDEYKLRYTAAMCTEVRTVANMQIGMTADGKTALYIDSAASNGGFVSDVLTLDGSAPVNLTVDAAGGSGMATWRASAVYCADIDGDGITDVPVFEGGELKSMLSWKDFTLDDTKEIAKTYYNLTDKWYMLWPEKWGDAVSAERKSGADTSSVTFFVPQTAGDGYNGEVRNAILTVYVFTGENSGENLKSYPGIKVLATSGSTVYGCFLIENDYKRYSLNEEQLKEAFNVIEQSWNTEGY